MKSSTARKKKQRSWLHVFASRSKWILTANVTATAIASANLSTSMFVCYKNQRAIFFPMQSTNKFYFHSVFFSNFFSRYFVENKLNVYCLVDLTLIKIIWKFSAIAQWASLMLICWWLLSLLLLSYFDVDNRANKSLFSRRYWGLCYAPSHWIAVITAIFFNVFVGNFKLRPKVWKFESFWSPTKKSLVQLFIEAKFIYFWTSTWLQITFCNVHVVKKRK